MICGQSYNKTNLYFAWGPGGSDWVAWVRYFKQGKTRVINDFISIIFFSRVFLWQINIILPRQYRWRREIDTRFQNSLLKYGWNPKNKNVIVIHGFNGTESKSPMTIIRDGKFQMSEINRKIILLYFYPSHKFMNVDGIDHNSLNFLLSIMYEFLVRQNSLNCGLKSSIYEF